jgi:hypothetical protein
MKRPLIACLLRAGRRDLANVVAYRVATAVVHFEQRGEEYVIWAPSYRDIQHALPAIKSAGFRYNPTDKSWRLPATKLTPARRKKLAPYVTLDPGKSEAEVKTLLKKLDGLRFFRVTMRPDGFGLSGDVWSFKETVKQAGGVWNRTLGQYLFEFATTNTSAFSDVIDKVQRREAELQKERTELDKLLPDLLNKKWTVLKCSVSGDALVIWSSDRKYRDVIKQHFPEARWSSPNWTVRLTAVDPRQISRFITAVDDLQAQHERAKPRGPTPVSPRRPKVPNAPYAFSRGEGYGGQYLPPGTVVKTGEHHIKEGWPPYITVVKTTDRYIKEDGLSVGVGDEQGHIYTYHCREATEQERSSEESARESRQRRADSLKRLENISREIIKRGVYPEPWVTPEGTRYDVRPQNLYGGGHWFIISGPRVWFIENNGADGDDWSHNNVRTGGAGAIGHYLDNDALARETESLLNVLQIKPRRS